MVYGVQGVLLVTLLVVVMIDLSAVALVVPLIPVKMRELGVRP